MSARFHTLASGSSGNCAIVRMAEGSILIDCGLGPAFLEERLLAIGANWQEVRAVLLTHTHTDHWKPATLRCIREVGAKLYCAPQHHGDLSKLGDELRHLLDEGLVEDVVVGEPLTPVSGASITAVEVPHDCVPTFAYRIDGPTGLFGPQWSIGYASDLGVAPAHLIEAFADVNLLAIEFNHCEELEAKSARPAFLKKRVMGDRGHLSNRQGAEAVQGIVAASSRGSLRHVVQLHLSRDCNRQSLAANTARKTLSDLGSSAQVVTATQGRVSRGIDLA